MYSYCIKPRLRFQVAWNVSRNTISVKPRLLGKSPGTNLANSAANELRSIQPPSNLGKNFVGFICFRITPLLKKCCICTPIHYPLSTPLFSPKSCKKSCATSCASFPNVVQHFQIVAQHPQMLRNI